jgi:IS30 family transposase
VANIARVMAILERSNDPNVHQALRYAQRAWIQLDQQNPASTLREERVGESQILAHSLITIPPSWPFACWSLDMIGPFTTAPGGFTHVLVAIDKFTKWIEYKPIAKLTPDRVVDFISDILHRFGFLNTIIMDLGSNFTASQFWEFCENACIKIKYVSVAHPWANGQVERANGMIIDGLKKRL